MRQLILLSSLLLCLTGCATPAARVTEIVTFRSAPNVTTKQLTEAAAAVDPIMASLPGYRGRELYLGPDGVWFDVVQWTTMDNAKAAAKAVMTSETCLRFFALIDEASINQYHTTKMLPQ